MTANMLNEEHLDKHLCSRDQAATGWSSDMCPPYNSTADPETIFYQPLT